MNRHFTATRQQRDGAMAAALLVAPLALASNPFFVDSTADAVDDNIGDGICHTAAGTCTLRAAIMQASNTDASVTDGVVIELPAGIYNLDLPIANGGGQLELSTPRFGNPFIDIAGSGSATTIIDGGGRDSVLHVAPGRVAAIIDLTIRHGKPSRLGIGGGIFNQGTLTMEESMITGNDGLDRGGGIYNSGTLFIGYSSVVSNQADYGGGISNNGPLTIFASTIASNIANADGGGIANHSAMTITNTTIAGNTASESGGGILHLTGSTTLVANIYNSTIVGNGADQNRISGGTGGGVYINNNGGYSSQLNIYNTVVAGNYYANSPLPDDCSGTLYTHARNRFGDTSGCTIVQISGSYATLNSTTLLGPLQNNGGPTQTIALLSGSNAIDAADPVFGCRDQNGNAIPFDQRGLARNIGVCDIGAFEYGAFNPDDVIFKNGFE